MSKPANCHGGNSSSGEATSLSAASIKRDWNGNPFGWDNDVFYDETYTIISSVQKELKTCTRELSNNGQERYRCSTAATSAI